MDNLIFRSIVGSALFITAACGEGKTNEESTALDVERIFLLTPSMEQIIVSSFDGCL
ncbi:MAG: hypothetical protein K0M45_02515 [Candidatus Paracaedibacteraceae bacterium]|nr:hypothetical protein [Candidatus Paracaedibacteraceae bacterium]